MPRNLHQNWRKVLNRKMPGFLAIRQLDASRNPLRRGAQSERRASPSNQASIADDDSAKSCLFDVVDWRKQTRIGRWPVSFDSSHPSLGNCISLAAAAAVLQALLVVVSDHPQRGDLPARICAKVLRLQPQCSWLGIFFLLIPLTPNHRLWWVFGISLVILCQLTQQKDRSLTGDDLSYVRA